MVDIESRLSRFSITHIGAAHISVKGRCLIWFGYIIREDFYLPPRRLDERGGGQHPVLLMKVKGGGV
jgi:hypothetical protein